MFLNETGPLYTMPITTNVIEYQSKVSKYNIRLFLYKTDR